MNFLSAYEGGAGRINTLCGPYVARLLNTPELESNKEND